jgi:hypothetical protein
MRPFSPIDSSLSIKRLTASRRTTMKLTLFILSALMVAMPVISSELLFPTTATFVTDWEDTIFSVVNNNLSAVNKVRESVLQPLEVLKFNQTGESASISVERLVWKGDYYYQANPHSRNIGSIY